MMRLNKKKEEAKAVAEAKSASSEGGSDSAMDIVKSEGGGSNEQQQSDNGAVSVLGIGGKRITGATAKKPTKKRTPGEIRIQKGFHVHLSFFIVYTHMLLLFSCLCGCVLFLSRYSSFPFFAFILLILLRYC
jgi:hypothetical protein